MVVSMPSVGQPRDHNPRAGFGILDFGKNELLVKRVEYDIEAAAGKIREAGLPEIEAERLSKGI
jgi:diadenosine tetraphosphatase ApaH/serine/threonine PP2A family protein phosphatase